MTTDHHGTSGRHASNALSVRVPSANTALMWRGEPARIIDQDRPLGTPLQFGGQRGPFLSGAVRLAVRKEQSVERG